MTLRVTPQWLEERRARLERRSAAPQPGDAVLEAPPISSLCSSDRYRSKLERDYAQLLELRLRAGQVRAWGYEVTKLRLADGAWFTPDFTVVPAFVPRAGALLEFHETKGFMRDAARLRLLVAASLFPWARFVLVRRGDGKRGRGLGAFRFEDVSP